MPPRSAQKRCASSATFSCEIEFDVTFAATAVFFAAGLRGFSAALGAALGFFVDFAIGYSSRG
jgi:hypothetical protein